MEKIVVTVLGIGLVGAIYWFFFSKRKEVVEVGNEIKIIVDGGYKPASIKIKKDKTTTLMITRKDQNSCLEDIILPDFRIKKYLPLNKEVEIRISPKDKGEFPFHCGMNMYHGKIIVE